MKMAEAKVAAEIEEKANTEAIDIAVEVIDGEYEDIGVDTPDEDVRKSAEVDMETGEILKQGQMTLDDGPGY